MNPVEESSVTTTTSQAVNPAGTVVQENVTTQVSKDPNEFAVAKINQVVWVIISLIMIVIGLRLVFLLLGAANVGIVSFIYSLSGIFIAPFVGIFQSPSYGSSFLDVASIVGLVLYGVLGAVINMIINLFSKRTA